MKLWRPPNRTSWWLAFLATLLMVPAAIVFVGIAFPSLLYPVALLLVPIPACYLVAVTRLHIAGRAILVLVLFMGIAYLCLPG